MSYTSVSSLRCCIQLYLFLISCNYHAASYVTLNSAMWLQLAMLNKSTGTELTVFVGCTSLLVAQYTKNSRPVSNAAYYTDLVWMILILGQWVGTFRQWTTANNTGLQLSKYINSLNRPSCPTASHCFLLTHSKDVIFKQHVSMPVYGKTV